MDQRILAEMSELKPRVYAELRRLNHQYTPPDTVAIERNNDGWELPAFKCIEPSGKTYFLFTPSSDVQRNDVLVWKGLERWRVSGTNRMHDRIIVDVQQENPPVPIPLPVRVADGMTPESELDDLLPLYRRKVFDGDITALVVPAQAKNEPLSLLMVDLDNFKAVNDAHGHPVGDEALIGYANILKAGIEGKGGKAYRLSGGADEVAILLPNFSLTESEALAERLRNTMQNATVSSKSLKVTVSIGVACFPDHANDAESLRKSAYDALNQAKRLGRNLVRVSGEPEEAPLEEVEKVIKSYRAILELKEDWDGEGASVIAAETWQRAVTFLRRNLLALWEKKGIQVESPSIVPLNDGSLDIHWKVDRRELLVNVPPDPHKRATYYGDNRQGGNVVEGDLDIDAQNHWLLVWLTE